MADKTIYQLITWSRKTNPWYRIWELNLQITYKLLYLKLIFNNLCSF